MIVNAPPGYGPGAIRPCIADNRRDDAGVQDLYDRARRGCRLSPAEAREFNATDERLRRCERTLARDAPTLAECEHPGSEIARAHDTVLRMTCFDGGAAQCRYDARRTHADLMAMFAEAERNSRITQRERRRFDDLQRRFQTDEDPLRENGLTLPACQALGRTIASDAREVRQMTGER